MQSGGISGMSAKRTLATYALGSKPRDSRPREVAGFRQESVLSSRNHSRSTRRAYTAIPAGSSYRRNESQVHSVTSRTPPRYPNYLPEMKARRAVLVKRSITHPTGSTSTTHSLMEEVNEAILRDLLKLNDSNIPLPIVLPRKSNDATGHALCDPPKRVAQHYPKIVMSLYRSPARKVTEWEVDSPTIQLDNMRHGQAVGPKPDQLPTPDSSHSIFLSMRGHQRSHHDIRNALTNSRTRK